MRISYVLPAEAIHKGFEKIRTWLELKTRGERIWVRLNTNKIPLEFTVAYLTALSLILGTEYFKLLVWAVFITWAGYFVLEADWKAF